MPAEVANIPLPLPPAPAPGAEAGPLPPPVPGYPTVCANCDSLLYGPFCSQCGQHLRDIHRSVWRFVVDFLDNVFGWDNKVLRTLRPLLARPGALTLDYLAGRRARYVHPLRLFLFTSAICLTLIQYFEGSPIKMNVADTPADKRHKSGVNFQLGLPSPTPAPASPAPASSPTAAAAAGTASPAPAQPTPQDGDEDDEDDKTASPRDGDLADQLNQAADKVRQATAAASAHAAAGETSPPDGRGLGDRIKRKVKARLKADGGPERMTREITAGVQRRVSWVALALLPIFAMMLRGLYWRRDSYYFAHFVFSLHYHTFLLLFFAAYTLLQAMLPASFGLLHSLLGFGLLLPGVYLFMALRRLYGETVRRTVAKVFVLGALHVFVLFIGLVVVGAWSTYRTLV